MESCILWIDNATEYMVIGKWNRTRMLFDNYLYSSRPLFFLQEGKNLLILGEQNINKKARCKDIVLQEY